MVIIICCDISQLGEKDHSVMIEMQTTRSTFVGIHETLSPVIVKSENNVHNLLCAPEKHNAHSATAYPKNTTLLHIFLRFCVCFQSFSFSLWWVLHLWQCRRVSWLQTAADVSQIEVHGYVTAPVGKQPMMNSLRLHLHYKQNDVIKAVHLLLLGYLKWQKWQKRRKKL